MDNRKNKTIGLALISVLEKILGLAKNLIFSLMYGTSGVSDAFNIALTIPDTFYSLFGSGVNSSFIPLYNSRNSDEKKSRFTSETLNAVTLITLIVGVIGVVLSNQIVNLFAPGFDRATHILTTSLVKISVWSVVLTAINNILISYLQINNAFLSSGLTPIALNIIQSIGIILSYYYGYYWLAIGILIGYLVQLVILFILAARKGYIYRFVIPTKNTVIEILILSVPIFLSSSVNRLNLMIDKAVASSVIEGGVSALAYADNLILFIKGIFGMPFITVAFPAIASIMSKNRNELYKLVDTYIEGILFYLIPITFGCICLDDGIVSLIYKRGAFDANSVLLTSGCLAWYAIGLPAFCIRDLLVKVFYAKKDSKTPTINMFIGIALNIALNFILSHFFGLKGLALASSISAYFIVTLLYFELKKSKDYILSKATLKQILKILFATIIMLIIIIITKYVLKNQHYIVSTLCCTIVGFFIYIAVLISYKVYSIEQLKRMLLMQNKNQTR